MRRAQLHAKDAKNAQGRKDETLSRLAIQEIILCDLLRPLRPIVAESECKKPFGKWDYPDLRDGYLFRAGLRISLFGFRI